MKTLPYIFITAIFILACQKKENPYDASGTFEAIETIVPANASGIIEQFTIVEGQVIDSGIVIGYIDSTQLYLRKNNCRPRSRQCYQGSQIQANNLQPMRSKMNKPNMSNNVSNGWSRRMPPHLSNWMMQTHSWLSSRNRLKH